jgi:hypothetical protein
MSDFYKLSSGESVGLWLLIRFYEALSKNFIAYKKMIKKMRQNKKIDVDKIGRRGGKSCGGSEAKNELPPLGGPVCSVTLRQKGRAVLPHSITSVIE